MAAQGGAPATESETQAELVKMAVQVQALKADTSRMKVAVASTAERIEARQQFLDALITGRAEGPELRELLPPKARHVNAGDAAISGVIAPFRALEQKQNALVDKVASTAETRLRDAESLIGRLGLKPGQFLKQSPARVAALAVPAAKIAVGGPYVPAGADDDQAGGQSGAASGPQSSLGTDPQFTELYRNWRRVEQLEKAMASLPSFVPVATYRIASTFGVRSDPFNGRKARHTGVDLAGARGQAVFAAASGKIIRAGRFGGYGNCVDIDHGNGVVTRYGHLATIGVRVGQKVGMGEKIATMGSTGRSTGNHLHYEVRIDNQAVNPQPFIDSASYILTFKKETLGPNLAAAL